MLGIMIKKYKGGAGGYADPPRDSLTKYFLFESMGLTIKLGCCVPFNTKVGLCSVDQTVPRQECTAVMTLPPMIHSPVRPLFSSA